MFWCEPCELWEVFIDDADFGGEVVIVNVFGEISTGVS
jgi:hypothetical protein